MNDRLRTSGFWAFESVQGDHPEGQIEKIARPRRVQGVVIGTIATLKPDGTPVVSWPDDTGQQVQSALSQVAIPAEAIGRRCTLAFERGEPTKPVILGLIQEPQGSALGYRIIRAENALILQCGAARIELRADGHIIVQGMQIDNQAYGPYRIKGASIKLN